MRVAAAGHIITISSPLPRKYPPTPPTVETALTYPMKRRIPTAHVAVARTAPTLHRMRLGSRSARAIRTHAAARRAALTCDQDARNRDPDAGHPTRDLSWRTRRVGGQRAPTRVGAARHRRAAEHPQPPGGTRRRRKTSSSVLVKRTPTWRTRPRAARPSRLAARTSLGARRLAGRPPPRSRCARSRRR